ncbi:hypothetical protein PF010_g22058 [Phytophthora fragariae]|uniref:Secreted protein n=1 Tax=Phytophthora fragariae TaxID=53985 RepID=A0A6G0N4H6_9STRA|nr:hypothetical protein PF010_g22058 [Phytophthora fragariae]KAE9191555.1 hypothetical protein PF004_g21568 [Phytophthora fragariae]
MTSYVHIALVTVSVVAQSAALNPHAHCSGSQTKSLPPPQMMSICVRFQMSDVMHQPPFSLHCSQGRDQGRCAS